MRYFALFFAIISATLSCLADNGTNQYTDIQRSSLDKGEILTSFNTQSGKTTTIRLTSDFLLSKGLTQEKTIYKEEEQQEEEFIFDPEGTEKMYCMRLYSYDTKNQKFVNGQSLKSQVRYADDGKTVYFKDITMSLGVKTWLKGEIEGDTIKIPFGQPLAYLQGKYLIFFTPIVYDDNTGNMEVQDYFKLIVKGDSLLSPTYDREWMFQGALGYVYITEGNQGFKSMDIDHRMGMAQKAPIRVPEGLEPVEYVFSMRNSYGNIYKKKVNVKKDNNDLYMQLSTSAPDEYIKGTIYNVNGKDSIFVESGQVITDSTFLYFYSLGDPVYDETGKDVIDFVPATTGYRMAWNESDRSITSSEQVFSIDFMDGMQMCKEYVTNPTLNLYPGDAGATPINPIWRSIKLDSEMMVVKGELFSDNYMSVVIPALDVDSNYMNPELMAYRVYINDTLYVFTPEIYKNLKIATTEIPYTLHDGYDFYDYDQLHYIYLYMEQKDVQSVGIQSVCTFDGQQYFSEIVTQRFDIPEDPEDPRLDYDLTLSSCRMRDIMLKAGEKGVIRGTVTNNGKVNAQGYNITYTVGGETKVKKITSSLLSGYSEDFELEFTTSDDLQVQNDLPVEVSVSFADNIADNDNSNNVRNITYSIYDQTFGEGKVLLEEFTAEGCGWCPYGAYLIHTAIEESGLEDNIIWFCHHEGYGVDWLTAEESTEYTALYGRNTFAPAWMLNRNQKYSDESNVVFGIPDVDEVKTILDEAVNEPTFVKLDVSSLYSNGAADITVTAQKSFSFDGQCKDPMLTVLIVEDSIKSRKQNSYDSHTITYHINALRKAITPVWGQNTEWQDGKMSASFHYEVPENYVTKNVKVIAFLHEYNEDVNTRRVFNTTIANLDSTTAIDQIAAYESSDNSSFTYNLQGQHVSDDYRGIVVKQGKKLFNR